MNGKKRHLAMQDQPNKNSFFNLQYMGYFIAGFDTDRDDINLEDFAKIAKFFLCQEYGILLKDPIWDRYEHPAEIIKEYYAILYTRNKDARERFEASMVGLDIDELNWLDDEIAKNQKEIERRQQELEAQFNEDIEFVPNTEGDKNGKKSD